MTSVCRIKCRIIACARSLSAIRGRFLAASLVVCAACLPGPLWGQASWQYSANTIFTPAGTNVGIGTASPTANLDIQASSAIQYLTSTTGTSRVYQRYNNGGGNVYLGIESSGGSSLIVNAPAYAAVLGMDSARALVFGTSNTARVLIDSAGRVGIGTTNPTQQLSVS